jgi:serine/threonine protein kinase/tetratricopeptide (TPR) repeat protein
MLLTAGTRLGPYEIVAPLGAGGMGEVYRASDPRLGREVAIKVLPEEVSTHPDRLARFEREAKVVANLNHPNIVVLHSIEEADRIRFLTMELIEGQSLDRLVTPGGLPVTRVLELGIPLSDALAAAHERGVVHRDLKPANVIVTREGRVKVLDFGLAKLTAQERIPVEVSAGEATQLMAVQSPISTVGQVVGTVPYMAPEQLRGDPVDARTDLFALGAILYELVTGRRPFTGATPADVSSAILRDPPAPLHESRTDLPPDLERIIGRCLEKDAERRIQTAKDVRNELELVRRAAEPATAAPSRVTPPPSPDLSRDVPSIAVLPFANRSRDPDDEYFSDGLADELLNVLAKIPGLRVAARSSAFTFKGKEVTVAEVGHALHVATVLEGSVRKSGNRVRIAVQLVKVSDGFDLWSETYDRTLEDIFAVQDDIAQSVVKELRTTLLGEEAHSKASGEVKADVAAAARGRGESGEAHRLFLQGRYMVERLGRQEIQKGIEYLQQAVAVDPAHALAWAWLSRARWHEAGFGWAPIAEGYSRARDAALRALELEPGLAEAHLALGTIQLYHDWDWNSADASFRRALELAPGSSEALRSAGVLARDLGRFEESMALGRRAVEQDPLGAGGHSLLGMSCRAAGRLEDAEAAYRKALEISPGKVAGHMMLSLVLLAQGRIDEALAEAVSEPEEWARLTGLATVQYARGFRDESDRALGDLIGKYAGDAAYQIGAIYAIRGDTEAALEWMDRAYLQRDAGLADLGTEPMFASLRADPRWGALLRKMGLPDPAAAITTGRPSAE